MTLEAIATLGWSAKGIASDVSNGVLLDPCRLVRPMKQFVGR